MKLGIMQPYFFPYIGYFQLISAVDCFVIYDNIQYTKKGWINRNRVLVNGKDEFITIPLEKSSDYLDIREKKISATFSREKLLRRIEAAYRKAPEFKKVYPMLEDAILSETDNLFDYIKLSLEKVCDFLSINKEFVTSSGLKIDHTLRNKDKVIAICKVLRAKKYLNLKGGIDLYQKKDFDDEGIALQFISNNNIYYSQYHDDFIENLSIIDVLMFNRVETITAWLRDEYTIST